MASKYGITNPIDPKDDPYGEKYFKMLEDELMEVTPPDIVPPVIVPRSEWGALPPKNTKPLARPIRVALFTQTETEECHTRQECLQFMQKKQLEDMNEFDDIQFNFYIGSDKTIYEGRGWEYNADKEYKNTDLEGFSIDIAYIGNYEDKVLSTELAKVGSDLIKYAEQSHKMHINYNITTYWEDHVEMLRKRTKYNQLDVDEKKRLEKELLLEQIKLLED